MVAINTSTTSDADIDPSSESALELDRGPIAPLPAEREALERVARALKPGDDRPVKLVTAGGSELELPTSLMRVLRTSSRLLASDSAVILNHVAKLLTIEEAAELLSVPPSFVRDLLEADELSSELIGIHHRIHLDDVLAFQPVYAARRLEALNEMTRLGQAWGMYDFDYSAIKVKRLADLDQESDS